MGEYSITLGKMLECGYKLPLNSYPIFCEDYRPLLNQKIINHYYFREIGFDTPDMFSFFLQRKMAEIMPFYNLVYKTTLIEYDPLVSELIETSSSFKTDTEKTGNESKEQNADSNGKTTNNLKTETENKTIGNGKNNTSANKTENFSDAPQTPVTINADGSTSEYLTTQKKENITTEDKTETQESGTGTAVNTGTVENEEKTKNETKTAKTENYNETGTTGEKIIGRKGFTPAEMLKQYRDTIINVDMMIIDELEKLFMGVY